MKHSMLLTSFAVLKIAIFCAFLVRLIFQEYLMAKVQQFYTVMFNKL